MSVWRRPAVVYSCLQMHQQPDQNKALKPDERWMNDRWVYQNSLSLWFFFPSYNWMFLPERKNYKVKQMQRWRLSHLLPYKSLGFATPDTLLVFHVLPGLSPVVHWTTVTRCTFLRPEDMNRNLMRFFFMGESRGSRRPWGTRLKNCSAQKKTTTKKPKPCGEIAYLHILLNVHRQQSLKQLLQIPRSLFPLDQIVKWWNCSTQLTFSVFSDRFGIST